MTSPLSNKQIELEKIHFTKKESTFMVDLFESIEMNKITQKKVIFIFQQYNQPHPIYRRKNLPKIWFSEFEITDLIYLVNAFPFEKNIKDKILLIIEQFKKTTYKAKGEDYPICAVQITSKPHSTSGFGIKTPISSKAQE